MAAETNKILSSFTQGFLGQTEFYISEQTNRSKSGTKYDVLDSKREKIGTLVYTTSLFFKVAKAFMSRSFPFTFTYFDNGENKIFTIERTFNLFSTDTKVTDGEGNTIGFLKYKKRRGYSHLKLFTVKSKRFAEISGTTKNWNFNITDPEYVKLGTIVMLKNKATEIEEDEDYLPGENDSIGQNEVAYEKPVFQVRFNNPDMHQNRKLTILASAISWSLMLKLLK